MDLNGMDAGIIVIFTISIIIGIWRGMIRETITLVSIIVSALVAYLYGKQVGSMLTMIEGETLRAQIGSGLVFSAVFFLGFIVKLFIIKAFKIEGVKPFDRLLGLGFGALRGIVVVVAVMLLSPKVILDSDLYKKSALIPKFDWIAKSVDKAMPNGWNDFPELDAITKQMENMQGDNIKPGDAKQLDQLKDLNLDQVPSENSAPGATDNKSE